jgi:hypothetical protein
MVWRELKTIGFGEEEEKKQTNKWSDFPQKSLETRAARFFLAKYTKNFRSEAFQNIPKLLFGNASIPYFLV